jgi:hypothetical protein
LTKHRGATATNVSRAFSGKAPAARHAGPDLHSRVAARAHPDQELTMRTMLTTTAFAIDTGVRERCARSGADDPPDTQCT